MDCNESSLSYPHEMEVHNWTQSYVNLSQVCRICAIHSDYLLPIYDSDGMGYRLDTKIHLYLPIQVIRDDGLPTQICYNCASTISSWHHFYNNCQESDHKLRSLYGVKDDMQGNTTRHDAEIDMPSSSLGNGMSHPMLQELNLDLLGSSMRANEASISAVPPTVPLYRMSDSEQTQMMNEMTGRTSTDVSENMVPNISPNIPNQVISYAVQEPMLVSDVGTQTEYSEKEQYLEDSATRHSLVENEGVIGCNVGEVLLRESRELGVIKADSFRDNIDQQYISQNFHENEKTLINFVPSRVSAIQPILPPSGTCSSENQSVAVNRSESVLVRNEAVRIEAPELIKTPSTVTSIEAAVIREHFVDYDCGLRENSLSPAVSVVRPTCLRRAPTKLDRNARIHTDLEVVNEPGSSNDRNSGNHFSLNSTPSSFSQNLQPRKGIGQTAGVIVGSPVSQPMTAADALPPATLSPPAVPVPVSVPASTLDSSSNENRAVDPSHSCFHCGKFISNIILLHAHERSHLSSPQPPTSFVCKFCNQHHNSYSEMQEHCAAHETDAETQGKCLAPRKMFLCKHCNLMFTSEERLSYHLRTHSDCTEIRSHDCKTCGEEFNTRSKLTSHLWSHAIKGSHKTFKCHICGKGFSTKCAVLEHRLNHTDEERSCAFKCIICGMAFGNNTLLGRHRATHTEEELARPFKCSLCGKAFARNHTLQIHHLTHSQVKSHLCSQCGKGFKMRNSLIQHMRTHQHPSAWPTYPCHLCSKNFRAKSRLRDHVRLHTGDKPYECNICSKRFHKVTALHTHEVSHTERRPYKCDICSKAFKWSKNLRQHKAVHDSLAKKKSNDNHAIKSNGKSEQCQCEICGKNLSGKRSLRHHMANIHNGTTRRPVQPTNCSICGKILSSSGGLARHIKNTHGGMKAFKCDMCDREYSTKVARDDHRRSHTGEKPFSCKLCPKTFSSLSNLHIHLTIHSDKRPHKCSYCDKQFKRKAHLTLHTRTHTGEKPYVCNICSRGFAQSNDLHKHCLTHSNDKAYACYCGVAFRLKRDLNQHQVKQHRQLTSTQEQQLQPVVVAHSSTRLEYTPTNVHMHGAPQSYCTSSVVVPNSDFSISTS